MDGIYIFNVLLLIIVQINELYNSNLDIFKMIHGLMIKGSHEQTAAAWKNKMFIL